MKFIVIALFSLIASINSEDVPQSDVDFITAFVHDLNNNQPQYLDYIATASTPPPPALIGLYGQVRTYTDDSYTTLLESGQIPVSEIQSYASSLPWATRIGA